jgi:hypothetical protein
MSETDKPALPDPAAETSRLDRIEARLAALEDRIAGAGAALPPPAETFTASGPGMGPAPAAGPLGEKGALWMAQAGEFVRNNPVLSLIGGVVVLVLLSHMFG